MNTQGQPTPTASAVRSGGLPVTGDGSRVPRDAERKSYGVIIANLEDFADSTKVNEVVAILQSIVEEDEGIQMARRKIVYQTLVVSGAKHKGRSECISKEWRVLISQIGEDNKSKSHHNGVNASCFTTRLGLSQEDIIAMQTCMVNARTNEQDIFKRANLNDSSLASKLAKNGHENALLGDRQLLERVTRTCTTSVCSYCQAYIVRHGKSKTSNTPRNPSYALSIRSRHRSRSRARSHSRDRVDRRSRSRSRDRVDRRSRRRSRSRSRDRVDRRSRRRSRSRVRSRSRSHARSRSRDWSGTHARDRYGACARDRYGACAHSRF